MTDFVEVAILKDDDGHTYVMPKEEARDFYDVLERSYEDYGAEFTERYGSYMLSGSTSELPLYLPGTYFK